MRRKNFYKMSDNVAPVVVDYTNSKQIAAVIPNQAVTPAMMLEMAKQGIPISADSAAAITGEINPSWDLPTDKLKHVDPAELWQEMQTIRHKVKLAHKRDKELRKTDD